MTLNDIKNLSKRSTVLTSYQEGYQLAAEVQKDPAAVSALVTEAERKLRNLKAAGARSDARATLEKRLDIKGNKIVKNIRGKADIAALLMFVNAKTSTATGIRRTRNKRAESLKGTLINAIRSNPQADPNLARNVEAAIDQMTPSQLQQFVKAYDKVLSAEGFDSHQQMKTIAADAMNRLINIKNQSVNNIIKTLTNTKAISETQRALYEAQINGLNLAYNNAENVAAAIRERRG